MNKKLTIKKAIEGCESMLAHGIQVSVNFMFGLPEKTWEDLQATKELILRLPANSIAISKFTLPPPPCPSPNFTGM